MLIKTYSVKPHYVSRWTVYIYITKIVHGPYSVKLVPRNFLGDKVRPVGRADSSAVLVVLNVKVRIEAKHSLIPKSLHDLLRETFTFIFFTTKIMMFWDVTQYSLVDGC